MERPLVSIVITSYNYAHYLPTAIRSALGQDYAPLEVLVLDNASTDDTRAVLEGFAGEPRLRAVFHPVNIGLTQNHNRGVTEARGDYVLFLSADDALTAGCISRAMTYYQAHPDVDVIYAGAFFMDAAGQVCGQRQMTGQPLCGYAGGRNELAAVLSEGCYMCIPTMLVRRSILERYGEFDETMHGADWEASARWARHGVRFGYVPEAFAVVRLHPSQHSGAREYVYSGRDMREYLEIVNRYLDAATPERYAGYEHAIRRLLRARESWHRQNFPGAMDEFEPLLAELHARIASITELNANRVRRRICYVVVSEGPPGPLERTLRSLVGQRETGWRAVVVQRPSMSLEPLARIIDADRIHVARMEVTANVGAMINTAFRIGDADIYTVARAGTIYGPDHAEALVATFADPAARIAVSWPTFYVDPFPTQPGEPTKIEELSIPPSGALDVLVGPEVAPEAVAFAREVYDVLNGYSEQAHALVDWELLVRATLHASAGFRPSKGTLEVHVHPGTRDFTPAMSNIPALVEQMHLAYPVTDPSRLNARSSYLDRLRAALRTDTMTHAGMCDFYRILGRTGVAI